ncbi:MAG: adenylyltransferase/cytidyltransferase family protein [bacterium]|nr:adenylyltransferase/cytidyltransferase family protein [bacterium]
MPQKIPLYKTGMVFGVFDGLHEGHQHLLHQAQSRCERLIVVVAHENVVKVIKGHLPRFSFQERAETLRSFNPHLEIILGDPVIETWSAFKTYQPDMVFLGYDQLRLAEKLKGMDVPFTFLDSHFPEKYKSSTINRKSSQK